MLALLQGMVMGEYVDGAAAERFSNTYLLVGALIAFFPIVVFGTIGFFMVRAYLRERRKRAPERGPRIRVKLAP